MSKTFRLNISENLHRVLMVNAVIRNESGDALIRDAVMNLVDAGMPAGIPASALAPTPNRGVVVSFADSDYQRVLKFAEQTGFSVSSLIRIAIALKYADAAMTSAVDELAGLALAGMQL